MPDATRDVIELIRLVSSLILNTSFHNDRRIKHYFPTRGVGVPFYYALRRLSLEQPFHPGDIIALAVIEVNEKDDVD